MRILGNLLACLVVLSVTPLAGCDMVKKLTGDKGNEGAASSEGDPAPAAKASGKALAGCEIPEQVVADVTVKKGCTVALKGSTEIREGATLAIEPGVKVVVDQGNYLWIYDGKLVAKGTEKEPIVFTSANKTQAPGDWVGIGFEDKTQAGTELDWVRIEYAGSTAASGRGAIDVKDQSSPKRISITNTLVTASAQAAVVNDTAKGAFARFEKNTFKKNKTSLEAHSHVLGSVGAGNTFSDPLVVRGYVEETTTWPAFDAPIVVVEDIEIGGDRTPAQLTVAPKTVLKFSGGKYLAVGAKNGGGLVANGVTFTSANGAPHEGDWIGLFVYDHTSSLQLDGAVLEYAGADVSSGRGAITFYGIDAKKVRGAKITNVTFKNNQQAAFASPDNDCGPFVGGGNKSTGAPICRAE